MKKKLYLISNKISWHIFKKLGSHDEGPTPQHIHKILWELLRKKQILCWFVENKGNDMRVGLEIPERYKNTDRYEINTITDKIK